MISWRDRGRGGNALDGGVSTTATDGDVSLPLGPGEWEEALGLPLCVVCQNVRTLNSMTETLLIFLQSDQIEILEKERSWKEEEFDFVLQFLRTVLLKRKFMRFQYLRASI
jgi:dynein light intermediate chain 1